MTTPPLDRSAAIYEKQPHRLSRPLLAHSSQSSAIVLLGVIGNIATVSLTRYATDAAPSLPSIVIRRLFPISNLSVPSIDAQTLARESPSSAPVCRAMINSS